MNTSYQQITKVIWDTAAYQANASVPLLTATYTLVVKDIAASETQLDTPIGALGVLRPYVFGMYLRQAYSDSDESKQRILGYRGSAASQVYSHEGTLLSSCLTLFLLI